MNDPKRLLDADASPLTLELLAAGVEEAPAPEVAERALRAVLSAAGGGALAASAAASLHSKSAGVAAAKLSVAPAASGAAALAKGSLVTAALVKWVGVGVVGLAAAGSAPRVWRWVAPAPVEAPELTEPAPRPPAPARQSAPPARTQSQPPGVARRETAAPVRQGTPAAPAPVVAQSRQPPVQAPHALGNELDRVDRARRLLQSGDATATLRELSRYELEFPRRQLELEVWMLRMEAQLRAGQPERARELARQILSSGASPAHAARARAVLGEPERH